MRRTNGKQGEINCQNLVRVLWDAKILSTSNTGKWDFKAQTPDSKQYTFEVKTNPAAITQYGGFSVEIGHKQNSYITQYITREPFIWEGVKVVQTGLSESKADLYIFHDNKKQYYFIQSKKLKEWALDIITNAKHRVKWSGYKEHTLNIQITLEELNKMGQYIDTRKKRGRKSVTEAKQ